jgi:mono/diheme cytochrome c family protein
MVRPLGLVCVALLSVAIATSIVASPISSASTGPAASTKTSLLVVGKSLYRKYCGQCHALSAALSAGFGNNGGGLGKDGGPSLNDLRVPFAYTVAAITEPTGGHEIVATRMKPSDLRAVAKYVARVTVNNPLPALPTDG